MWAAIAGFIQIERAKVLGEANLLFESMMRGLLLCSSINLFTWDTACLPLFLCLELLQLLK
jgi:hypothetical protein